MRKKTILSSAVEIILKLIIVSNFWKVVLKGVQVDLISFLIY